MRINNKVKRGGVRNRNIRIEKPNQKLREEYLNIEKDTQYMDEEYERKERIMRRV